MTTTKSVLDKIIHNLTEEVKGLTSVSESYISSVAYISIPIEKGESLSYRIAITPHELRPSQIKKYYPEYC